jgi:putative transposase
VFFRWVKQNLKIKAFLGNTENAVMTQIYVALIAYLLLCYFNLLSGLNISLQNLIRLLHLNLFMTCTLKELLEPPPLGSYNINDSRQLSLNIA